MRNEALEKQWNKAEQALREHWRGLHLPEQDFSGKDAQAPRENLTPVLTAMRAYFKRLDTSRPRQSDETILGAMKRLFAELKRIDQKEDRRLLMTGDREVIVPIVNEAAETAGLRLTDFGCDDPTQKFRHF